MEKEITCGYCKKKIKEHSKRCQYCEREFKKFKKNSKGQKTFNLPIWIGGFIGGLYASIPLMMLPFKSILREKEFVILILSIFLFLARMTAGPLAMVASYLIQIFNLPEGIFEGDGLIILLTNILNIILWIVIGAIIGAFLVRRKKEREMKESMKSKQYWKKGIVFGILFSLINLLVFSLTFLLKSDLIKELSYPFLTIPIFLTMFLYPVFGSLLDRNFHLIIWLVAIVFWILFPTLLFKLYDTWKTKGERIYKFSFNFLVALFILFYLYTSVIFMAMGAESGQEDSFGLQFGFTFVWFLIGIWIVSIVNKIGRKEK